MKITKLKQKQTKNINHIVFDIETDPYSLKFKLAVLRNKGKDYVKFTNSDLTKEIIKRCFTDTKTYIWAHNAQFDFSLLDFDILGKHFDFISFNTAPFFVIMKNKNLRQSVIFLDTMSFIKDSLENIGILFNTPKLKIDFKSCSIEELIIYCIQDVLITEKIVKWIINIQNLFDVPFCITLPSLAFRVFRKEFLKENIFISENIKVLELERDSYFGGRVEVFDMNKYDFINVYDFNSLYPSVYKYPLPVKCIEYLSYEKCLKANQKILKQKISNELIVGNGLIAKVKVDIPYTKYPPVPLRAENKKLIFPIGKFETVLTTPEIEEILPFIKTVKELAVYQMKPILKEYGEHFFNLRVKEKDKTMKLVWKLLLTSLYGKFAQRKFIDIRIKKFDDIMMFDVMDLIDDKTGEKITVRWLGGKAFIKEIEPINPKSAVSIASHITAYARIKLLRALRDSNSIYCDTDSIFTTQVFTDSKQLGELKFEDTYHDFQALGNKFYISQEVFKCKGVPRDSDVYDITNKSITFLFNRVSKIKESIRRFGTIEPRLLPVIKEMSLAYDKRIILPNGQTKPIKL